MTDIFDTIKDIALNTAKKADTGYKASRLKLSVIALNKMLESQYRELGAAVYKMCKNEEAASREECERIAAMTVQIDGIRKRIAVLERRIEYILGLVRCPDCGNTVKMKNAYCSACGRRLAAEEEDVFENENQMTIPKEDV